MSAPLAGDKGKGSGFSEADLDLLWESLECMWDHDRSAARGEMAARRFVVFRHSSPLGNAPAHRLFERVRVARVVDGEAVDLGEPRARELPPARSFGDYVVDVDVDGLTGKVAVLDRI